MFPSVFVDSLEICPFDKPIFINSTGDLMTTEFGEFKRLVRFFFRNVMEVKLLDDDKPLLKKRCVWETNPIKYGGQGFPGYVHVLGSKLPLFP